MTKKPGTRVLARTRARAARLDQSARRAIDGSYGPVQRSVTRPGILGLKRGTQRLRVDLGARP